MNHVSGHSHLIRTLRLIGFFFLLQYLEGPQENICTPPRASSYYTSMVPIFQLDMYQAGMSNKVRTEGLLNAPTSTAAAWSISVRISILLNVMQMTAGRSQLVRMRSRWLWWIFCRYQHNAAALHCNNNRQQQVKHQWARFAISEVIFLTPTVNNLLDVISIIAQKQWVRGHGPYGDTNWQQPQLNTQDEHRCIFRWDTQVATWGNASLRHLDIDSSHWKLNWDIHRHKTQLVLQQPHCPDKLPSLRLNGNTVVT